MKIQSLKELKELASSEDGIECSILLNGGVKSVKHIIYDQDLKVFYVFNYCDESEQELTEEELLDPDFTNIGIAIIKNALILEEQ